MTKGVIVADHEENEANETSAVAETASAPAPASRPGRRAVPRPRWVVAAVVLAVLVTLAALLWPNGPEADPSKVVTVQGVDYVTNVRVEDQGGYVYVFLPVNADATSVVLEVGDERDNEKIREFLGALDTFVPGEHVLALSDSSLHFILDGIEE